jgi:hypothetical protein
MEEAVAVLGAASGSETEVRRWSLDLYGGTAIRSLLAPLRWTLLLAHLKSEDQRCADESLCAHGRDRMRASRSVTFARLQGRG